VTRQETDYSPNGGWVTYPTSHVQSILPSKCISGKQFGDQVDDMCCSGGSYPAFDLYFSSWYSTEGNCKQIPETSIYNLQECYDDFSLIYGEDCDSDCVTKTNHLFPKLIKYALCSLYLGGVSKPWKVKNEKFVLFQKDPYSANIAGLIF
jgi:hypothetical protein